MAVTAKKNSNSRELMKELYLQPCFDERIDDLAHGVNPLVSRVFCGDR